MKYFYNTIYMQIPELGIQSTQANNLLGLGLRVFPEIQTGITIYLNTVRIHAFSPKNSRTLRFGCIKVTNDRQNGASL